MPQILFMWNKVEECKIMVKLDILGCLANLLGECICEWQDARGKVSDSNPYSGVELRP